MKSRLASSIAYANKLMKCETKILDPNNRINIVRDARSIFIIRNFHVVLAHTDNQIDNEIKHQIPIIKHINKSLTLIKDDTNLKDIKKSKLEFSDGKQYGFKIIGGALVTQEFYEFENNEKGILSATFRLLIFLSEDPDYKNQSYTLYDDMKKYVNTNIAKLIMNFYI